MIDFIKKEDLLNLKLCIDNIYLDKYVELINANVNTKKEKHLTAVHHIIPRYYYKENNLEVDNSIRNIVNLSYPNHILAHYYLALCSENIRYRFHNENMLLRISSKLGKETWNITEEWILNNIPLLESLYKERGELQSYYHAGKCYMTEESKKASSIKNKKIKMENKYKFIHKDDINTCVPERLLDEYLNNGWQLGKYFENKPIAWNLGLKTDDNVKIKLSLAKQNRVHIHKDNVNKFIIKTDLEKYLLEGWEVGYSDNVKLKISDSSKLIKKDHFKGKHHSEEGRNKIGKGNSGGKYIHKNGLVKHVKLEELEIYLNDGWLLGNPTAKNKEPHCWVNNGKVSKYIALKDLQKYLNEGYVKGRKL